MVDEGVAATVGEGSAMAVGVDEGSAMAVGVDEGSAMAVGAAVGACGTPADAEAPGWGEPNRLPRSIKTKSAIPKTTQNDTAATMGSSHREDPGAPRVRALGVAPDAAPPPSLEAKVLSPRAA
jgi:hypothetical protein